MGLHKRILIRALLVCLISFGYIATVNAALEARPGGLVYDPDIDLTWVADPLAVSGGQLFEFSDALDWAADLEFAGFSDWRLPQVCMLAPQCSDTEYGHLFYHELGGTTDGSTDISDDPDFALFSPDFQGGNGTPFYWTGVEVMPGPGPLASAGLFEFQNFFNGILVLNQQDELNVWAVHDGDIGAPARAPEPGTLMLMGIGLAGLLRISRFC